MKTARIVLIFVLLCIGTAVIALQRGAIAQLVQNVLVTNTNSSPVPVTTQNPLNLFTLTGAVSMADGSYSAEAVIATVPSNQVWVIRNVSGWAENYLGYYPDSTPDLYILQVGQNGIPTEGNNTSFLLPPALHNTETILPGQPTMFVAYPGQQILFEAGRTGGSFGSASGAIWATTEVIPVPKGWVPPAQGLTAPTMGHGFELPLKQSHQPEPRPH